jgi:hypothetical protein
MRPAQEITTTPAAPSSYSNIDIYNKGDIDISLLCIDDDNGKELKSIDIEQKPAA